MNEIIDEIKEEVKGKWSAYSATLNAKGQSSVGLWLALNYGKLLLVLGLVNILLMLLHHVSALITTDVINNNWIFIGTQFGAIFTYLGVHKNLDNKANPPA